MDRRCTVRIKNLRFYNSAGICNSPAESFCLIGNCVAFSIKQKALRVDRTAAKRNLSLRDPPQAENPAEQDSIFTENREKPRKTWDSDLSASLFCDKLS